MLFLSISFTLGTQREPVFWWNMGFSVILTLQPQSNPLSLYSTATQKSCVGPWRWLSPPTPLFCVGDTNMLVSEKAQKINLSFSRRKNKKIAFLPTQNPNASQWNIGCVGHVHFIFFVLISFASGTQPVFLVEYGL